MVERPLSDMAGSRLALSNRSSCMAGQAEATTSMSSSWMTRAEEIFILNISMEGYDNNGWTTLLNGPGEFARRID